MTVQAEVNRPQERIWYPVLESLGYRRPAHANEALDKTVATDIIAGGYWFAVRSRNSSRYSGLQLRRYMSEFTIRYKRPSGAPTEFEKLFESHIEVPDLMAYGWWRTLKQLDAYVIISVEELQQAHRDGLLEFAASRPFTNKDERRSTFYAYSIPKLRKLLDADRFRKLFIHWSNGHPANG